MPYDMVVLVKQVPDANGIRVDKTTGKPQFSGQLVMNSADEVALEEALQIKEVHGGSVTAISAGGGQVKDVLTRALAMGADAAILVPLDAAQNLDSLSVAKALAAAIGPLPCDLLLAGYNSDDGESAQVAPAVAELAGLPLISSVIDLQIDGTTVTAQRDMEDGKQTVTAQMPVVVTAIAGLNEPRYPSLKGIMAAKKKPLDTVEVDIDDMKRLTWSEPTQPERQVSGVLLQDVPAGEAAAQLVAWLKQEKLI